MCRRGEVLRITIHSLCLTLVTNVLHLVLVGEQDWRDSLCVESLLLGLPTERCPLSSRNGLAVVDRLEPLRSQAEARVRGSVHTWLV